MLRQREFVPERIHCALCLSVCLLASYGTRAWCGDPPPLHEQIDRLIAQSDPEFGKRVSRRAADAEFLRRVYLDLTGRIPTASQARVFMQDSAADKRLRLIDQLLASPEHARHLQYMFDVALMQRLPEKHVKLDEWHKYLFRAFRENKSWDELTRELLSADGADEASRAASRFLLDRELKSDETTRDIGRIFLGRDMQCAQCHDHPSIDDYLQRHYYGVTAFLQRSYVFKDPKSKQSSIGEKAEGTVKFTSVFTSEEGQTQPRILDLPEIEDPPADEEPYLAKPDKKTRGVPKYSRRLQLAKALTNPAQLAYRQNIANRLWALVMGRGLVEPVDMFHELNPASHPPLLQLLADDLVAHHYDMRRTIREMMLSQAYQRSSELAEGAEPVEDGYYAALLKPLTPEQLAWSSMQAAGVVQMTRLKISKKWEEEQSQLDAKSCEYAFQLEQAVYDALKSNVTLFVEVFGASGDQRGLNATADQALFLMNGRLLTGWLQPAEGNLVGRLLHLAERDAMVRELYWSTLTRAPTAAEIESVNHFLMSCADEKSGIQELVRIILCSAEFRLNH